MIIDLASQHVKTFTCERDGKLCESLYLYTSNEHCAGKIREMYAAGGLTKEVQQILLDDPMEVTYINVGHAAQRIQAFRSITSHYELFYSEVSERGFILTDHMVNMLSYIPAAEREVCLGGAAENAMYQHNYGKDTFVKGIFRLGHGEELTYSDGKISVLLKQQLETDKYDFSGMEGTDLLEKLLRESWEDMKDSDHINTLSGGVDSTLTQIIMGEKQAVCTMFDEKNFEEEREYALAAADMLDVDLQVYDVLMKDYMDEMIDATKNYGLSPYNISGNVIHLNLAKHVKEPIMIVSEHTGSVCGLGRRTPYTAEAAEKYPIEHPYNYANYNSGIGRAEDLDCVKRFYGTEVFDRQLEKRNQYVLSRIKNMDTSDNSEENVVRFGHIIDFFSNSGVSVWEQTEMGYGKEIRDLYATRRVLEGYLSYQDPKKYYDPDYAYKPYTKKLLERLLPAYEVTKKKLTTAFPRTWMVTEGPMAGYFREHDIPDFVDKSLYDDLRNPSWKTSWGVKYLIMYSMWYEHVMTKEVKKLNSCIFINEAW